MNGPVELKGQELFKSLSMEGVDKINQISTVQELNAGDTIFEPNQDANNLYVLLDGLVALRFPAKEDAFSTGLIRIEKGGLIGAGALLGTPKYITQAYCVKKSKLLAIDGKKLRDILEEDPVAGFDVVVKIAQAYFERYIFLMDKIQNLFAG